MPALPVADSRTTRTHRALASSHARITARDPATIRTQIAVSQIAAPTGDERRRAEWVAARLQSLGLTDARIDAAGNVVASRPGVEDAPPVLVCAHLDTVFGRDVTLTFRRDGERLTGPGIGDSNWHFLVVMVDPTASAFYVDGIARAPGSGVTIGYGGNMTVDLGCDVTTTAFDDFNGQLDNVKIFDGILTPQEVMNLAAQ